VTELGEDLVIEYKKVTLSTVGTIVEVPEADCCPLCGVLVGDREVHTAEHERKRWNAMSSGEKMAHTRRKAAKKADG